MRYFDLVRLVPLIGLSLGPGRVPAVSAEATEAAKPAIMFATELAKTFRHPRCKNCHSFAAKGSAVAEDHERKSSDCKSCHFPAWKAPKPKFSFTGLSPEAICLRIKRNTPDPAKMKKHLKKDGAIIWALVSGRLAGRQFDRAPPRDRKSWFAMVDRWIDGGRRCGSP